VDQQVLIDNIDFFGAMFREDSNWIEGRLVESTSKSNESSDDSSSCNHKCSDKTKIQKMEVQEPDGSDYIMIKIIVPKPIILANFLKSLYENWLDITDTNCVDYYKLVDYLRDERSLASISKFIKILAQLF